MQCKVHIQSNQARGLESHFASFSINLACWLFLFFIVAACFFQSRICLWEMLIYFDASCREKPLSTFQRITHKYMSFSCSVNHLLFLVTPLHPSSCSCSSCSFSFTTCRLVPAHCSSLFTACMLSCSSCSCCSLFGTHMSSCSFYSFTTHMSSCSCSLLSLSSSPMITASMSSCCCSCGLCSSSTTNS